MQVVGIIIHHSVCPAINGKGYDFFIMKNASILPAPHPSDPSFIHICLEGDFSDPALLQQTETKDQLFLLMKLVLRLAEKHGFRPNDLFPHTNECPSSTFPWEQLVISDKDGYH